MHTYEIWKCCKVRPNWSEALAGTATHLNMHSHSIIPAAIVSASVQVLLPAAHCILDMVPYFEKDSCTKTITVRPRREKLRLFR